jgi:hypothetical protein
MRELVDAHYPDATCIRVVQDNLSTRTAGALYEAFALAEARRILRRVEFHYTPKHASWLNMVEIEIGVLRGQCLNRRTDDPKRLISEIAAWEKQRNTAGAPLKWMFTTEKARAKMGRACGKLNFITEKCRSLGNGLLMMLRYPSIYLTIFVGSADARGRSPIFELTDTDHEWLAHNSSVAAHWFCLHYSSDCNWTYGNRTHRSPQRPGKCWSVSICPSFRCTRAMAPISKMAGYRPEKGRLQRMSRHEAARTPLERLALESMAGGRWSRQHQELGILFSSF